MRNEEIYPSRQIDLPFLFLFLVFFPPVRISSSTLDIIITRGITTFVKLDGIYGLTGRKESIPSEFLGDGAGRETMAGRQDERREGTSGG